MRHLFILLFSVCALSTSAQVEDSMFFYESSYIPFKSGESWTLYNVDSGTVRNDLSFDAWVPQGNFSDFYAFQKDGRYGFIGYSGDTILPFEYDTVFMSSFGMIARRGGDWLLPNHTAFVQQGNDSYSIPVEGASELADRFITMTLDSIAEHHDFVYLYRKGKVGLYSHRNVIIPPEYTAVQPLHTLELYSKSPRAVLAFDGKNYRFFSFTGEDLLGVATPEFELMKNQFVRYKHNGRWHYYNFGSGTKFDSNGNDVVLYSALHYKIYGPNRKYPTFRFHEKNLSGFEDYFPLTDSYVAFRNNGKIGLMNANGTLLVSAKYDKIEAVDTEFGYFKFFKGDTCGLMTESGVELFPAEYANIISTEDPNRLLILQNGFTGVVDKRGKMIIPPSYDYIKYGNDCFLLEKNNQIGLASNDGKIIFEPQFMSYSEKSYVEGATDFYAVIFKDYAGKLLLANTKGKLTEKKFDDYNFGNQTFKLYRNGEIEVLVLSENTELEERVVYPNVGSLIVNSNENFDRVPFSLSGWDCSYLEENQMNGLFGLRYFTKKGLAVSPVYKEIQPNTLNSYFGVRPQEGNYQLTEGISLTQKATYDQLYIGSAAVENTDLISAESLVHSTSSKATYTCLVQDQNNHGTIEIPHDLMPFSFAQLKESNLGFSKQFDFNSPKMYLIDAKPVVCDRKSAEISLYEYYHYFNVLGGLRLTPETAPLIMNPNLGVRFEGGSRRVTSSNGTWSWKERLTFSPWKDFHDFRFTEQNDFIFSKSLEDTTVWDLRDFEWNKEDGALKSRKCLDYKELPNLFNTTLELTESGETKYVLHEDFPDFEYILSDSLERNYFAGRLILENENSVSLVDPDGKIYGADYDKIRYLGEGFFGVKSNSEWRVTDRDGTTVIDRVFTSIGNVIDGRFAANNDDFVGIYSVSGDVVVETSESLKHVEGSLYTVRLIPQEVWFDAATRQYDTLRPNEEYLGNRTFLRELNDDAYELRKFGQAEPMKISAERKPRCELNAVIFKKRKKLFVMDAQGEVTTFKKASGPRKMGTFLVIEDKKEKHVLNADGSVIHSVDEEVRLKNYQKELLVHTIDTNYLVAQSGNTIPFDLDRNEPLEPMTSVEVSVVSEAGNYGAVKNGQQLLPSKYDRLTYQGNGEFEAKQEFTVNVFNAQLQQINPIPYHQCYFIDEDLLIIELNREWYFFKKDQRSWSLIEE